MLVCTFSPDCRVALLLAMTDKIGVLEQATFLARLGAKVFAKKLQNRY